MCTLRAGLWLPALLALGLAAAMAQAGTREPLYQWADDSGTVRYTTERERIPERYRAAARIVEPGLDAQQNAALLPGARTELGTPLSTDAWLKESLEKGGTAPDATPAPPPVETGPSSMASGPEEQRRALDARIAELEKAVARDEATLGDLISDPARAGQVRESDEMAEIAARLPRLQAELRQLRQQRAELVGEGGADEL